MNTELSSTVVSLLQEHLNRYLSGVGADRMRRGDLPEDAPQTLEGRGVLAEAQLSPRRVPAFLQARGDNYDEYFTRRRVLLDNDGEIVGSAVVDLSGIEPEVVAIEAGGVESLLEALHDDDLLGDDDPGEARIVRIPDLYLTVLAVISGDEVRYQVLEPPGQERPSAQSPEEFLTSVDQLWRETQEMFPELA